MPWRFVACGLLVSFSISSCAQVANDRIQNRISLHLDAGWHTSFTTKSDVEWDCINKALTNTCLIYHNDQWFTIRGGGTGTFYLNVSNQNCKKLLGVQMVIIEGDPCKTSSYRLKKCIPFTDQSDFFVKLDSLDPLEEYLINIDGYLGDLCKFDIAFSSTYQGIPLAEHPGLHQNVNLTAKDSIVQLEWTTRDSLLFFIRQFQVYRKDSKERSARLIAMPMVRNAFGSAQENYSVTDTLREPGEYTYSIYGITSNDMVLLSRESIRYPIEAQPVRVRSNKRQIDYFVRNGALVKVVVLDNASGRRLFSTTRKATKGRNTLTLDFTQHLEMGLYNFLIILENKYFREEHLARFEADPQ
jgi:hypothetical protein